MFASHGCQNTYIVIKGWVGFRRGFNIKVLKELYAHLKKSTSNPLQKNVCTDASEKLINE